MTKRLAMVSLIVLGIVLQNTCPFGLAGKTALASPMVHHCPLKSHHKPCKGNSTHGVRDMQKNFKPFTLITFTVEPGGRPELLVERAAVVLANKYEEVIMPLPVKPPKSGPVSYC